MAEQQRNGHDNSDDENEEEVPWFDYQFGQPRGGVPGNVKFLRIGVVEADAAAANGSAPVIIELQNDVLARHETLQRVQIHVGCVSMIPSGGFQACLRLEEVEFVGTNNHNGALIRSSGEGNAHHHQTNPILSSIKSFAFETCCRLRTVKGLEHAAPSLRTISMCAFDGCHALFHIDLSMLRALESLGSRAFATCCSLKLLDLSGSVNLLEINEGTFCQCTALVNIHLPANLTRLGTDALRQCISLSTINLPQSLSVIGFDSFSQCTALKRAALPSYLTHFPNEFFGDCKALTTVSFHSGQRLRNFLNAASFAGCDSLHTIEWPGRVPRILWPLLLEQLFSPNQGILAQSGIGNRSSIAFNFLSHNSSLLFVEEENKQKKRRQQHT